MGKRIFTIPRPSAVVFFVCPFATPIWAVRLVIWRLQQAGYSVVAYDTPASIFLAGNPNLLGPTIDAIKHDIQSEIRRFKSVGMSTFGFYGTSLGSFILYNVLSAIPELRWGVFNTGGNLAQSVWRLAKARKAFMAQHISLNDLEQSWHEFQYCPFPDLTGGQYAFMSSPGDRIAPLADIKPYLVPIRQAGADIGIIQIGGRSHLQAAIIGLWRAAKFIAMVRAGEVGERV